MVCFFLAQRDESKCVKNKNYFFMRGIHLPNFCVKWPHLSDHWFRKVLKIFQTQPPPSWSQCWKDTVVTSTLFQANYRLETVWTYPLTVCHFSPPTLAMQFNFTDYTCRFWNICLWDVGLYLETMEVDWFFFLFFLWCTKNEKLHLTIEQQHLFPKPLSLFF